MNSWGWLGSWGSVQVQLEALSDPTDSEQLSVLVDFCFPQLASPFFYPNMLSC